MTNRNKLIAGTAAAALLVWFLWHSPGTDPEHLREALLAQLPADATSVAYLDLHDLRGSAFLSKLLAWAPQPPSDEEYTKFVQSTGFDYERDLDRVAMAFSGTPQNPRTMAVAEGKFDQKKIEDYSTHFGTLKTASGKTIYAVTLRNPPRTTYFTFLRGNQVAMCSDASCFFQPSASSSNATEWKDHFRRLAGTPVFVLMRQDSPFLRELAERGPGGWRSPQLATLLGQLQWISIGAKPDGEQLRVVAEGESSNETTIRQLHDMLAGLLVLAQAGLEDPKASKPLDPKLHDAYQTLLKAAEVQKQDRGNTQSVRLILELPPELLESAHGAAADPPAAPIRK